MVRLCKKNPLRSKNQELKTKQCQYPGCDNEFQGRGKAKYCEEHRKTKYKKYLYQSHALNVVGDSNIYINHKNAEASKVIRSCALKGCLEEFEITVIPNQHIYPKYCNTHRNEYKRQFFTEQQGKLYDQKK
jgi:hypothetical protein